MGSFADEEFECPSPARTIDPKASAAVPVPVDWLYRQVSPAPTFLTGRPPPLLSSSLTRFPDLSLSLPYEIRSQHICGKTLSNACAELKDHAMPFTYKMTNSRYSRLGKANTDGPSFNRMAPQETLDAKALAVLKSHSEAERKRRERINAHLTTLRSLLPSCTKTDKASLLAEVIDHVKDLKRQADQIAVGGPLPTDVDEITVDRDVSYGKERLVIRASLCCYDRPDLLSDLIQTLGTLRLKAFRAEIVTLGGRVKSVFLMTRREEGNEEKEEFFSINSVQEALKAVLDRPGSTEFLGGGYGGSKRQRLALLDVSQIPETMEQGSF